VFAGEVFEASLHGRSLLGQCMEQLPMDAEASPHGRVYGALNGHCSVSKLAVFIA